MRHIIVYASLIFICGFSGITYRTYTHDLSTKVHVLILDPSKVTIEIARAQDLGVGAATVYDLAQHFGAVAAINGGFFRLNQPVSANAMPAGILKVNNTWHGIAYRARGAIGWNSASDEVLFDIVQTDSTVEISGQSFPVHVTNKILDGNRASLLSDSYIDHVKLIDNISLLIQEGRVTDIYSTGSVLVPKDSYIYNVSGLMQERVKNIRPGDRARINIVVIPLLDHANRKAWNRIQNIMGGGPLLIRDGKIINDYLRESVDNNFPSKRRARSAVGVLSSGHWLFVLVEESLLSDKVGMTLSELAHFMYDYGCTGALNLDGGKSAAMYMQDNLAYVRGNLLLDRSVADALIVLPKPEKP